MEEGVEVSLKGKNRAIFLKKFCRGNTKRPSTKLQTGAEEL